MVTIEQVARYAGVSVATVSRALNNSPTVKPATAERVHQAIEALHYIPNRSARNLRRNESRVILALAPNFSNPYYSRILTGIGDLAREQEYSVLICNTAGQSEAAHRQFRMLENQQADGAILLSCQQDFQWLSEYAGRFPIVQCCEYIPDLEIPSVSIDNYAAALETVRYLLRLGHRRIVMMGAANLHISTFLRREGYRNAMEEAGLPMPPGCYEEADAEYSFASGCVAAQKLLALEPRPTAVFCISDILALSVISVAQEMGIEVPRALTVTGFDDVDYTTIFHPYLTTIAQPCYEMGRQSTALILDMLRGSTEDIRRRFLPYRLVERESAAPPEKQE